MYGGVLCTGSADRSHAVLGAWRWLLYAVGVLPTAPLVRRWSWTRWLYPALVSAAHTLEVVPDSFLRRDVIVYSCVCV